jgi:hypothetical protein
VLVSLAILPLLVILLFASWIFLNQSPCPLLNIKFTTSLENLFAHTLLSATIYGIWRMFDISYCLCFISSAINNFVFKYGINIIPFSHTVEERGTYP